MSARAGRLAYIDWLRGLAVVFMIGWHVIDAWTLRTARDPTAFAIIAFFAGWAAPLFLFLAGVAVPLAGTARMSRGLDRKAASWVLQKRGWQIFLLAHLFRFQSFLLNPNGQWNGLLKPDILNILGLGLVATAFIWGRAATQKMLTRFACAAAVLIVILSPLTVHWWWPTLLHPRLEAYIRPVGNQGVFTLFPAIALVFAGAIVGGVVAESHARARQELQRLALWGTGLLAAGALAGLATGPAIIGPWIFPVSTITMRVGAMTLALALCGILLGDRALSPTSLLMVFGRTSLFVYWVHVELAYGIFSFPLHYALPLPWSLFGYGLMLALMYTAARLLLRYPVGRPIVPAHMQAA